MAIGSGGGLSLYEPEPSYQQGVQSTGSRTTPDVSMVADPATGAWIADPYNLDPSDPFEVVGGTSLSAPAFAGLVALVNQGRVAAGEATLNSASPTETQQALYSLPQADYNSITSGSNGYTANAGYNLVTGLGTPVADLMVPDLIDYQGPGTTYAGPTVGPLQDATLDRPPGPNGGGGTTNAFNVFSALTMGSNGFGQAQVDGGPAAGMPISGTPATVVASHAVTTTPMPTAVASTFGPATGHVSTGCVLVHGVRLGDEFQHRPASLSQPAAGATLAPVSNGHATTMVAGSTAQPGTSTPITYGQPNGFPTTARQAPDSPRPGEVPDGPGGRLGPGRAGRRPGPVAGAAGKRIHHNTNHPARQVHSRAGHRRIAAGERPAFTAGRLRGRADHPGPGSRVLGPWHGSRGRSKAPVWTPVLRKEIGLNPSGASACGHEPAARPAGGWRSWTPAASPRGETPAGRPPGTRRAGGRWKRSVQDWRTRPA